MDIVSYLLGKNSAGGGDGKYAPYYLTFQGISATDLTYEIQNVDTTNIVDMTSMFQNCAYLTSINISGWNTSNVTSLYNFCRQDGALQTLDLKNINLSNLDNMSYAVYGCSNLLTVDFPTTEFSKNVSAVQIFTNSGKVQTINMGGISMASGKTINLQYAFFGCKALTTLDIRSLDTSSISNSQDMLGNSASNGPADNCLIIVKTEADKTWFATNFPRMTNVKTPDEL